MIARFVEAAAASFKAHPAWWLLGVMLVFSLFPSLDLWASGLFYDASNGGWVNARAWFAEFVRKGLPVVMFGVLLYIVVLWLAGLVFGERFLGINGRVTGFLAGSLALGPGLIVNSLLKEHWGRARPSQIQEFGGASLYTPPWMVTDQCDTNCSFASGHGALGFWVVAFAFLVPRRWRAEALAAALLFGLGVSSVRIVQGGHFLSDTVWSGIIVVSTTAILHRLIFREEYRRA